MKITVLQQDIVWKNIPANLRHMGELLEKAPKSDIYLFPEMCSTGFCMQPENVAEQPCGATVTRMKEWAVKYDAAIAGTVMTVDNGKYYNRMYFVTPEGVLGHYDKVHLFEYSGENLVYTPGTERVIWEWKGLRIRPAICYDLRFPLFLHNNQNYDLLLISANFPESRILAWDTLVRARAIENQCYVAASNRVGVDEYGNYVGHSVVLSPYGEKLGGCRSKSQGSATGEIDFDMVQKMRKAYPLMQERYTWL
ncbi:MAG: nitrilase family protein [Bacteroidaceae bacterium]|nr:nitrilase family protein [Bacteroidales bacterium]MBQ3622435.1 nitrilase family protein [Bacteroidaceae bacterium]